jgi:hypothetical protein
MSKEGKENTEKELGIANTPNGELKILKNFRVTIENREIILMYLEDETIGIVVKRFEENNEEPYTKLITEQSIMLTKLTVALLMACLTKANIDFGIDADSLIDELKAK